MRTQKLLAIICVAALGSTTLLKAQNSDSDAQAKAREILRQKIAEMNTSAPATPAPDAPRKMTPSTTVAVPGTHISVQSSAVATPDMQTPPATMAAPKTGMAASAMPMTSGNGLNSDEEAKVREAMRQAKADLDAKDAETTANKKTATDAMAKTKMNAAAMATPGATMTTSPAMANVPASMVPGSKEARLFDLLQLYKTDRISPSEYHEQRAKILSEP